ncbi:MAG: ribosomal-processing cysteine protease Prp [Syntrophomonadaceae bacterium]|jgi:uncharacterized protein YsxB (DUF464 family)
MVEITINYQDKRIISFEVNGHAGYAPPGQDIYCAGVSAVTQTALLGLLKHLSHKPVFSAAKGNLTLKLPDALNPEEKEKAQIILSTMETGLLSMQEAYGEFIRVKIRRC